MLNELAMIDESMHALEQQADLVAHRARRASYVPREIKHLRARIDNLLRQESDLHALADGEESESQKEIIRQKAAGLRSHRNALEISIVGAGGRDSLASLTAEEVQIPKYGTFSCNATHDNESD